MSLESIQNIKGIVDIIDSYKDREYEKEIIQMNNEYKIHKRNIDQVKYSLYSHANYIICSLSENNIKRGSYSKSSGVIESPHISTLEIIKKNLETINYIDNEISNNKYILVYGKYNFDHSQHLTLGKLGIMI